jgi:D-glycero-alpha-D-manno-heptose-7-phosphate kinase
MYSIVFEAKEIFESLDLTDEECFLEIARLLQQSWNFKKKLSNTVTNLDIEALVNDVLKAGVLGVKLLGAGGGGFLYCLGDTVAKRKCEKLYGSGRIIPIRFQNNGSSILRV